MKNTLIFTFIVICILFISSIIFIACSTVEPGYQKDGYSDYNDVFPYRLNSYESELKISYDTIIKKSSLYKYPENSIKKLTLNNILHYDLKNDLLIENNIIYAEINDIANILDAKLKLKSYGYTINDNIFESSVVLEKYDKACEYRIILSKDNISLENYIKNDIIYILKIMPGAIIEFNDGIKYQKPFISNQKIYIPLSDVMKFFNYEVEYNKKNGILKIQDNSMRENLNWKNIYLNAINEAVESNYIEGIALLDVTEDNIPELFFLIKDYCLFETADLTRATNKLEADPMLYCFWYNEKEKTLEIKADSVYWYKISNNKYKLIRRISMGAWVPTEARIWDEETKDFVLDEFEAEGFPDEFKEFELYSKNDIKNGTVNISNIINKM